MKAIYTTCTYNHIARALSLADSVRKYSPNTTLLIGIVDSLDDGFVPVEDVEFIKAADMMIPFFQEMCMKYTALELNSALKPYFANFILNKNEHINQLAYLDSDILLYDDLHPVYNSLKENSIVLSPHSLSTINNDLSPGDRNFLRTGIFNSGFFAIKRDAAALSFLEWWMGKLRNECFIDSKKGMFAEQLWLNLVPLYFEKVHILRHKGCNVAHWNLHERKISKRGDKYFVNETEPLIFYHFSGTSINCFSKNSLSGHQNRYTFSSRPDVIPLFQQYIDSLNKHAFEKYDQYYFVTSKLKTRYQFVKWIFQFCKKVIKNVFYLR